ncbi:hypothetical protein LINGRAHAP2_LOCUS10240 [Linum grandiflorum]
MMINRMVKRRMKKRFCRGDPSHLNAMRSFIQIMMVRLYGGDLTILKKVLLIAVKHVWIRLNVLNQVKCNATFGSIVLLRTDATRLTSTNIRIWSAGLNIQRNPNSTSRTSILSHTESPTLMLQWLYPGSLESSDSSCFSPGSQSRASVIGMHLA